MKLLFDQNLSPRLRGHFSTSQIEQLLRANSARIGDLDQQQDAGFLVLL